MQYRDIVSSLYRPSLKRIVNDLFTLHDSECLPIVLLFTLHNPRHQTVVWCEQSDDKGVTNDTIFQHDWSVGSTKQRSVTKTGNEAMGGLFYMVNRIHFPFILE